MPTLIKRFLHMRVLIVLKPNVRQQNISVLFLKTKSAHFFSLRLIKMADLKNLKKIVPQFSFLSVYESKHALVIWAILFCIHSFTAPY